MDTHFATVVLVVCTASHPGYAHGTPADGQAGTYLQDAAPSKDYALRTDEERIASDRADAEAEPVVHMEDGDPSSPIPLTGPIPPPAEPIPSTRASREGGPSKSLTSLRRRRVSKRIATHRMTL